ncbi:MAG: spermidine/putrescine ABC transporter substrate-binding protein [Clostridia bacterium]|nr:spermidine/putrescine ABC transporter substrate-binding protein [Clostridia bacterium]
MKRILSIALALCVVLALFTGCSSSGGEKAGGTLNLYTWAEMFDPEVLADFEKETGITVNYTNFDFDETMLARLEAANGGDYDLIIADDYIIETVIAEGLAQKLDKSKIENFGNINPIYQGQFYDPTDEYTAPYGAGVQTIVYNPAKVSVDVKGYSDLWDASFEDDVAIIANYRVIIGMAEKVLGYSYNTDDISQIEEAGELLYKLAPNIRLIKDDNIQDDLVSGEVDAAVMYTSQVTMAKLADPTLKVVYPKEGIGFGIMGMFVPSKAPNADAAHAFINYILKPEVSKKCFEYLGYYCTTKPADDLIDEAYREFLVLPSSFKAENMEMIGNISAEAAEKQDEIWTRFKALCE